MHGSILIMMYGMGTSFDGECISLLCVLLYDHDHKYFLILTLVVAIASINLGHDLISDYTRTGKRAIQIVIPVSIIGITDSKI